MDAFYASVEQRENPELQGKPIAVGGNRDRGVVAAASYEARKFGVRSAMSSKIAVQRCPDLIFVRPRFSLYRLVSSEVMEIFHDYTDKIEPLSIDEAFLDVTENKKEMQSATHIANEIRQRIKEKTSLTASAGISYNKFLAKMASDINKPNGFFVIPPEAGEKFVEKLPVEKFYGIGKVTAERMHDMGLFFGSDLKKCDLSFLVQYFGKQGQFFYNISRAIDNRPVHPDRIRKSVGIENTYDLDITAMDQVILELEKLSAGLEQRLQRSGFKGKTLTLKLKFDSFEQMTRSKTVDYEFATKNQLNEVWRELVEQLEIKDFNIRLLGISVSNPIKKEIEQAIQLRFNFT